MANDNNSAVLGRKHGLSAALDHFFRFSERGSSLKTEIGAGCIAFFVAVCALIMNTQIIGAAYGNYAGSYLAATLLCFAGSLLLGLLCNLPLVQTANMALSAAVISMLSAAPGVTYWNLMAITLVAAVVYLLVALTPAKKFLVDLLPDGVRKALPVGLGLYTVVVALRYAGITADGALQSASGLMTLSRFYFWIMAAATLLYLIFKAIKKKNALLRTFGLMVGAMWIFGIVFYMDQFVGGQTASTIVYHRLNVFVATDGASPYNIGAGFAGLQLGRVFTEGFNFSGYNGSVFLLFVQGILSFLFLGLYSNTTAVDAALTSAEASVDEASEKKIHVLGAALNVLAPILGVPAGSIGAESTAATEDGGKTGLSSVVASIGFLIASFTWLFVMFFATGTNGAGMWINDTEVKLAVYVNDTFAFADLVMVFVGAAMLKGLAKVDWKKAKEVAPFLVTVIGIACLGNLALGVALGVIAYAIAHFVSAERKEKAAVTAILCCLMLLFSVLSLNGISAAKKASSSAATTARGTLGEVSDFSFDFNSGEYSFTGTDNALFYVVRLYLVEDGVQSPSAQAQSERIDADEANQYSGRLNTSLVAGEYNAYVLAVASGYTPSSTLVSGASTAQAQPTVAANWQEDGPNVAIKLTITAGDSVTDSYAVTLEKDGAVVYRNPNASNGETVLAASDLGLEALSKDDHISVTVAVNAVPGFTAPDPVKTDVTEQQMGGPGGMPGGGMAGFEVEPAPFTFEEGAETIEYVIGSHAYFNTTGTLVDSEAGVKYTYQLAKGDPQAPFDCKMFLYLNEDGTARLTVSAEGPVAATDLSGSWTSDGGNITVTF